MKVGFVRLFDDADFRVGDGENVKEGIEDHGNALEVKRRSIRLLKAHQGGDERGELTCECERNSSLGYLKGSQKKEGAEKKIKRTEEKERGTARKIEIETKIADRRERRKEGRKERQEGGKKRQ